MTGGKASEFRGRGLASGAWMGGRVRGRLKGHGVVRSGVNLDGVGVNPGESESSIFYYCSGPEWCWSVIYLGVLRLYLNRCKSTHHGCSYKGVLSVNLFYGSVGCGFLLLLWVYCPTFRKEPTGQVCGAQMLLAQGEKELILVVLLNEMVMSCSLEDSFFLD